MSNWLEVAVTTPPDLVEAVADIMQQICSGGVVVEDPALILSYLEQGTKETVSPDLKTPAHTSPVIKGYVYQDQKAQSGLADLTNHLATWGLKYTTKEVMEEDWAYNWRRYYKTIQVGRHLVVKPSWEAYAPQPEEIVLDLDPGMAFGCGTHATTALCLELLEDVIRGGETVYDVGTGSGILAVAAALLGAKQVVAVDHDGAALRAAQQNVANNRVSRQVLVLQGDLLNQCQNMPADVVVANIIADAIISLAPDAARRLKKQGLFIASGVIKDRAREVQTALEQAGLQILRQLTQDEWVAILSQKI